MFALLAGKRKSGGIDNVAAKLFHTQHGSTMVSALFGLALAFLFQRVCKDRKCIVIEAPPMDEIKTSIYELEDTCYKYTAQPSKCEDAS